uniref:VWFC domain-containing protein n=1 Tax=Anopheles christyi TaxID=43041 RepID=A0A182K4B9_9DIPT
MYESDQTELENYGEATGCYYNYNHYGEGDRIMTNEPCLNCTCHDRMLMCYLRVCPFTKAIGQDCTIEKREDQCCPVITCPEVEVQLVNHQTTASPSNALGASSSSEVGSLDQYGCSINERFYPEGAQVPSNPQKPCELCYCIRNMTTCVMQECTLHIDGCQPIYNKGVCCPVKYDCEHDKDTTLMLEDESTTTVRPTPGFILTTTVSPSMSTDCVHSGETYADGSLIMTDKPCEHCYCMRGDIVCAVQECGTPLENEGKNCTALPPAAGQCCPDKYICDGSAAAITTTTVPEVSTSADDDEQNKEQEHQTFGKDQPSTDEQLSEPAMTTTQDNIESTTMPQKVHDMVPVEKEEIDNDDDQQEQEHIVPQFEDIHTDDSNEQENDYIQGLEKEDDGQSLTTARPSLSGKPEIQINYIPGHIGSSEIKQDEQDAATTVVDIEALVTTMRPALHSTMTLAEEVETATVTHADAEANDVTGTTIPPAKDTQEPEADSVQLEKETDKATISTTPISVEVVPSNEVTTVANYDIIEQTVTTAHPSQMIPLANADERENEIDENREQANSLNVAQPEDDDSVSSEISVLHKEEDERAEQEEQKEAVTTPVVPVRDEVSSEQELHTYLPAGQATVPEHDKTEVSTEKKEATQKADDEPHLHAEQDFVELPPAIVVTELPPIPTTSDEPSTTEQTPELPKDEILPNMPLEADSHVLSDSITTEHAPTFGDRKEDDAQEPNQSHVKDNADMDEPVEMNTIIPLDTEEQKVEQPVVEKDEQGQIHEHIQLHDADEDIQSGEEPEVVTHAHDDALTEKGPGDDKVENVQHTINESPDKLFPVSIPGEGDCLIDGVTYENGASVPPSGTCQVACHCSNSIVHCEMVRCEAAPSTECTLKNTLPGECCPTYTCRKETSSTMSSTSVASTEIITVSDADSDEEQVSADVSASNSDDSNIESTETITKKTDASDSQSLSTTEDDNSESDKPSEAESDSAGFDLDDEVFKPFRPQEPSLDEMHINFFAGNRPTTANYDDEIILTTAAPTNVQVSDNAQEGEVAQDSVEMEQPEQSGMFGTTQSGVTESMPEEQGTTINAVERGHEYDESVAAEQDEHIYKTTAKTVLKEPETTFASIMKIEDGSVVEHESIEPEATTVGVEFNEQDKRVTTISADEVEDNNEQVHTTPTSAISTDKEQEVSEIYDGVTTSSSVAEDHSALFEQDEKQEHLASTTIRSVALTEEVIAEKDQDQPQNYDDENEETFSTSVRTDKPLSVEEGDQEDPIQEATTSSATAMEQEELVTEIDTKRKTIETTIVPTVASEQEDDRGKPATTPTPADDLQEDEHDEVKLTDEAELTQEEVQESNVATTSRPLIQEEPTTQNVQESESTQIPTVAHDEIQPATTISEVVNEKELNLLGSVTVKVIMEEDDENIIKTTEVTSTQTTTALPNVEDDSIIFHVDDNEDNNPILKPTLLDDISTQNAVKPGEDTGKPYPSDEQETDDDNLISPVHETEQDGGFHFPQGDDEESEESIHKPTLNDTEHLVAVPLSEEIWKETVALEPVDQIKKQENTEHSTIVYIEQDTVTPSTVTPHVLEKDHDEVTESIRDDEQEDNEIESSIHLVAVPEKKPEQVPLYDEIEETEQQTDAPSKNLPEPTTIAYEQESEPQLITEAADKDEVLPLAQDNPEANYEREQPITATQPSSIDTTAANTQDFDREQDNNEMHSEYIPTTTAHASTADSAEDGEHDDLITTPTAAQVEHEQKQQTTPTSDLSYEEEEDVKIQHVDKDSDEDEDVPVATTPQVFVKPVNLDGNLPVNQIADTDLQSVSKDSTTQAPSTEVNEQTSKTDVDDSKTPALVFDEQQTTLSPEHDDSGKPEFSDDDSTLTAIDEDSQHEDVENQTDKPLKIQVPQATDNASEEFMYPTEPTSGTADVSEPVLKDSKQDETIENDEEDQLKHTTLAPQITQNEKHQPHQESDAISIPTEPEKEAPMEDDVDFEEDQDKLTTASLQTIEEQDKQTTTPSMLSNTGLDEEVDTETDMDDETPEEKIHTTTARILSLDSDNKLNEKPETDLSVSIDDADEEVTYSTTFATPERTGQEDDTEDIKPVEKESAESMTTTQPPNAVHDESIKSETESHHKDVPSSALLPVTTAEPFDDITSQENDNDEKAMTKQPMSISEEDNQTSTTVTSSPVETEHDLTSEGTIVVDTQEQTSEATIDMSVANSNDKAQPSVSVTDATSEEEHDDAEQPQTDDLNADDESSEEEESLTVRTATKAPEKAPTATQTSSLPEHDVSAQDFTPKADEYTTVATVSESQVTEQPTSLQKENDQVLTEVPAHHINDTTTSQPLQDEIQTVTNPVVNRDEDNEYSVAPEASHEQAPVSTTSPATTTIQPAEIETEGPFSEASQPISTQEDVSKSTVPPAAAQDDKLDDKVDPKPKEPEIVEIPHPVSDDSEEQQEVVKPTLIDDEHDDQQKVQEAALPEAAGMNDDSSNPAKPTQQSETVGPSYGAPGQHYDSGYGHMPPHYPPSSYEDDYGEEEDPAAFGPGTCRYGGKLYVSAQQIPRDDPCDFCFCFRSDIICLQQSCPPPISGCNEEPITGFCCPRYECPVSMATVLNVTTSTTTTTTTLPPHFLSHAYKGHVQKRGCQIQGKPYNVGETVASASGPCMRCTCGGDGQMQCEPKACSPEPMLQQMIAVAAARRR